jgi:cell division protein FtsB
MIANVIKQLKKYSPYVLLAIVVFFGYSLIHDANVSIDALSVQIGKLQVQSETQNKLLADTKAEVSKLQVEHDIIIAASPETNKTIEALIEANKKLQKDAEAITDCPSLAQNLSFRLSNSENSFVLMTRDRDAWKAADAKSQDEVKAISYTLGQENQLRLNTEAALKDVVKKYRREKTLATIGKVTIVAGGIFILSKVL